MPGGADGNFPGGPGEHSTSMRTSSLDGGRYYYTAFAYEHSGAFSAPAFAVAATADRVAPVLKLNVERPDDGTNLLSVYLRAFEQLDDAGIVVRAGEATVSMRRSIPRRLVWSGTLDLSGSPGELSISASAPDSAGNVGTAFVRIAAASLSAAEGGSLSYPHPYPGYVVECRVEVPPGGLRRDAVLTILPSDSASTGQAPDSLTEKSLPGASGTLFRLRVQPADILLSPAVISFRYDRARLSTDMVDGLSIQRDGRILKTYLDPPGEW